MRYCGVFVLSFLLLSMKVFAATPAADLTQLLSNIQTMQADFTQTLSDKQGKMQPQQSIGHMALQRPGQFRWEIKKPIAQLIVANNKKLWIYDPDLEQVTIRLVDKEIGNIPGMLLSNSSATIEKQFKVQTINNAAGLQWFALFPKTHDSMWAFIKMGFSHGQIREINLQDQLGHMTVIEFYNINLNRLLPAKLFNFTPPPHADVIDETRH